jgi:uncharacterized protein YegL
MKVTSSSADAVGSNSTISVFCRKEDGAITIFACFMVFMMLMVCGIAVDLMQNELTRTKVQNTLDRAVLAASEIDQERDPDVVVDDYFAKAGMTEFLDDVKITPGADLPTTNFRIVEATARTRTPALYMSLTGVNSLPVYTTGTAEEVIENTEISLVIDISGSMRNNNKIGNLRIAAKEFVSAVLDGNAANTTSLNIVPYAGQVNPGPLVFDRAGGTRFATFVQDEDGNDVVYGETRQDAEGNDITVPYNSMSSCLDLASADFNNINLPSGGYNQTAHFMNWTIHAPTMDWGWCPQDNTAIQYAQNNVTRLHTFIDNIRLHDGTGTQYGMKYGVALLNPTSNSTFQALNAVNLVPDAFTDRPADFTDDETRKIIVLMTDGQITDQYRPINELHPRNGDVALLDRGNNRADRRSFSNRNTNVANFNSVCEAAKAQGITIYTIAFEAPSSARDQMRDCATSSAYFYTVEGIEISTVFKSIARQINDLRLVN